MLVHFSFKFTFLFKLIVHIFVQIDCSFFVRKWLLIFLFKLIVDISVQIQCLYVYSSQLVILLSKLIGDIIVQIRFPAQIHCSYFCSKWLFIFFIQIDGSYFCSKWLFILVFKFTFLFRMIDQIFVQIEHFFVQKGLLIFLFKLIVDISVQKLIVDISVQIDC